VQQGEKRWLAQSGEVAACYGRRGPVVTTKNTLNHFVLAVIESLNYPCKWMVRFVRYSPSSHGVLGYHKNKVTTTNDVKKKVYSN
jgi:hypothetical protein